MNFWDNVLAELDYQCKTRKWLAAEVGFNVSTIGTGQRRGSIPAADVAIKIADALGVTIEYLLNKDDNNDDGNNIFSSGKDIKLLRKYKKLIYNMENLNEKEQKAVESLAENLQ